MGTLTGLGPLVRLALRLDRLRLPIWIGVISILVVVSAASLPPVYPDDQAILNYVTLFGDNPALVAFAGPGYGFDNPNLGVILVNETQLFAAVGVALMSIFLLNRHTRAEEDAERTELLRSCVVGRHAPIAAAVLVVVGANLATATACAVGFVLVDYEAVGSVALAGSLLAVGLVFTGVAAVAAQVTSGGRATLGTSSAVLAGAVVLRAAGDVGDNALRLLSPIGWAQDVRAFAGERWGALAACAVLAAGLVAAALWLSTRRDLGSGLVAPRRGRPVASRALPHPLGLAVRLQRGAVVGWCVGLLLTGAVYGSIGEDIEQMIADNPAFADFLAQLDGASVTDSFLATSLSMLAMVASGFAVAATLRLRSEEVAGRAEPLLAAAVRRSTWAMSHVAVAMMGATAVVASGGLGVGAAYAVVTGDSGQVLRLVAAALTTIPAVLVLVGVTTALVGVAPRAAMAAWAGFAVVLVIGFVGELLRLPLWSRQLSPFEHLSRAPAEPVDLLPMVVLVLVAGTLVAAGLAGLARRDLHTS